jgi:3-hydroxyisobutyrate dehydrogenase
MEIAFLGTGTMGAPMARHLLEAGHRVRVWNRSPEKAEPLARHGARIAADPAEAVDGADVVVTMLLDAGSTEAAVGDALRCARPGTIWWQAGTVGIEGTERLSRLAEQHGLTYVDAPVLGTRQPAEDGKLLVLAAGPSDALDRLEADVFGPTAANVLRVGEAPGAATRLKLVANHWVFVLVQGVAETVQLARALDVDPALWLQAIAGGPLDSGYAQVKGAAMIGGEFPPSFALDNAAKDTRLILEAAGDNDLALGFAQVIRDRFAAASAAGHGEQDMSAVVLAGAAPGSGTA